MHYSFFRRFENVFFILSFENAFLFYQPDDALRKTHVCFAGPGQDRGKIVSHLPTRAHADLYYRGVPLVNHKIVKKILKGFFKNMERYLPVLIWIFCRNAEWNSKNKNKFFVL